MPNGCTLLQLTKKENISGDALYRGDQMIFQPEFTAFLFLYGIPWRWVEEIFFVVVDGLEYNTDINRTEEEKKRKWEMSKNEERENRHWAKCRPYWRSWLKAGSRLQADTVSMAFSKLFAYRVYTFIKLIYPRNTSINDVPKAVKKKLYTRIKQK